MKNNKKINNRFQITKMNGVHDCRVYYITYKNRWNHEIADRGVYCLYGHNKWYDNTNKSYSNGRRALRFIAQSILARQ